MRLLHAMRDNPIASEIGVFQTVVAWMMSIQGHLTTSYQRDRYLWDRLQEAIYLPAVQDFLKDRPVRNSQQLINRVANKLSNRPNTAGTAISNWTLHQDQVTKSAVIYSLGQNYGGGARIQITYFVKNRPNFRRGDKTPQHLKQPNWM